MEVAGSSSFSHDIHAEEISELFEAVREALAEPRTPRDTPRWTQADQVNLRRLRELTHMRYPRVVLAVCDEYLRKFEMQTSLSQQPMLLLFGMQDGGDVGDLEVNVNGFAQPLSHDLVGGIALTLDSQIRGLEEVFREVVSEESLSAAKDCKLLTDQVAVEIRDAIDACVHDFRKARSLAKKSCDFVLTMLSMLETTRSSCLQDAPSDVSAMEIDEKQTNQFKIVQRLKQRMRAYGFVRFKQEVECSIWRPIAFRTGPLKMALRLDYLFDDTKSSDETMLPLDEAVAEGLEEVNLTLESADGLADSILKNTLQKPKARCFGQYVVVTACNHDQAYTLRNPRRGNGSLPTISRPCCSFFHTWTGAEFPFAKLRCMGCKFQNSEDDESYHDLSYLGKENEPAICLPVLHHHDRKHRFMWKPDPDWVPQFSTMAYERLGSVSDWADQQMSEANDPESYALLECRKTTSNDVKHVLATEFLEPALQIDPSLDILVFVDGVLVVGREARVAMNSDGALPLFLPWRLEGRDNPELKHPAIADCQVIHHFEMPFRNEEFLFNAQYENMRRLFTQQPSVVSACKNPPLLDDTTEVKKLAIVSAFPAESHYCCVCGLHQDLCNFVRERIAAKAKKPTLSPRTFAQLAAAELSSGGLMCRPCSVGIDASDWSAVDGAVLLASLKYQDETKSRKIPVQHETERTYSRAFDDFRGKFRLSRCIVTKNWDSIFTPQLHKQAQTKAKGGLYPEHWSAQERERDAERVYEQINCHSGRYFFELHLYDQWGTMLYKVGPGRCAKTKIQQMFMKWFARCQTGMMSAYTEEKFGQVHVIKCRVVFIPEGNSRANKLDSFWKALLTGDGGTYANKGKDPTYKVRTFTHVEGHGNEDLSVPDDGGAWRRRCIVYEMEVQCNDPNSLLGEELEFETPHIIYRCVISYDAGVDASPGMFWGPPNKGPPDSYSTWDYDNTSTRGLAGGFGAKGFETFQFKVQQRNCPVTSALSQMQRLGFWFAPRSSPWTPATSAEWRNGNSGHGSFACPLLPKEQGAEMDLQRLQSDEVKLGEDNYLQDCDDWFPPYADEELQDRDREMTNVFYMPWSTKDDKEFDRHDKGVKEIIASEIMRLGFTDMSIEKKENSNFWFEGPMSDFGVFRTKEPIEMYWPPYQRQKKLKRVWVFNVSNKNFWKSRGATPQQFYPARAFKT